MHGHHGRILEAYLRHLGLRAVATPADGNCQFHAVLRGLRGCSPERAPRTAHGLRRLAVAHLGRTSDWHASLDRDSDSERDPETYLRTMARDGAWGDERTLVALARALGVQIVVHQVTPKDHRPYTLPPFGAGARLHVGHLHDNHYVAVVESA